MSKTNIEFIFDPKAISDNNEFGITHVRKRFDIPEAFIDECRRYSAEIANQPFGNIGLQIRLWPDVCDEMIRIGHNPEREPIEATKRLLRKWGLDYMIIDQRQV